MVDDTGKKDPSFGVELAVVGAFLLFFAATVGAIVWLSYGLLTQDRQASPPPAARVKAAAASRPARAAPHGLPPNVAPAPGAAPVDASRETASPAATGHTGPTTEELVAQRKQVAQLSAELREAAEKDDLAAIERLRAGLPQDLREDYGRELRQLAGQYETAVKNRRDARLLTEALAKIETVGSQGDAAAAERVVAAYAARLPTHYRPSLERALEPVRRAARANESMAEVDRIVAQAVADGNTAAASEKLRQIMRRGQAPVSLRVRIDKAYAALRALGRARDRLRRMRDLERGGRLAAALEYAGQAAKTSPLVAEEAAAHVHRLQAAIDAAAADVAAKADAAVRAGNYREALDLIARSVRDLGETAPLQTRTREYREKSVAAALTAATALAAAGKRREAVERLSRDASWLQRPAAFEALLAEWRRQEAAQRLDESKKLAGAGEYERAANLLLASAGWLGAERQTLRAKGAEYRRQADVKRLATEIDASLGRRDYRGIVRRADRIGREHLPRNLVQKVARARYELAMADARAAVGSYVTRQLDAALTAVGKAREYVAAVGLDGVALARVTADLEAQRRRVSALPEMRAAAVPLKKAGDAARAAGDHAAALTAYRKAAQTAGNRLDLALLTEAQACAVAAAAAGRDVRILAGVLRCVPLEYDSPSAAAAAAEPGDWILLCPGTYAGTVWLRRQLSVVGAGWERTTLDGGGSRNVIQIRGAAASGSLVARLRITHGYGHRGGGVGVNSARDVVIIGNRIEDNASPHDGGGIAVWNGSATILNNWVVANRARYGAGIIPFHSDVFIAGNVIARNSATDAGGGIRNDGVVKAYFNTIVDNTAGSAAGGLDNFGSAETMTVRHCILWGNTPSSKVRALAGLSDRAVDLAEGKTAKAPAFVAAAAGNWQPAAGSPAVDLGAAAALEQLLPFDLAGRVRAAGKAPDAGALEAAAAAALWRPAGATETLLPLADRLADLGFFTRAAATYATVAQQR